MCRCSLRVKFKFHNCINNAVLRKEWRVLWYVLRFYGYGPWTCVEKAALFVEHVLAVCTSCHTPAPMYHDGCVSDSVFWYDHTVAVFLPLWRLVLNVGDGDRQLHWTAPVPPICSHDFPGDVGPLWHRKKRERSLDTVFKSKPLVWHRNDYRYLDLTGISKFSTLLYSEKSTVGGMRVGTSILEDNCIEFGNPYSSH